MYVVYVWTGGWLISLVLVTSDNKGLLLLLLLLLLIATPFNRLKMDTYPTCNLLNGIGLVLWWTFMYLFSYLADTLSKATYK